MNHRPLISAAIAAAMLSVPATRVHADAGDFVAGAIIGGVLGHAVRNNQPRKKVYRSTKSTKKVYRPKIPATQSGRQIQTSLNYFGFDAGGVDGQLGRKSRDAISRYQAYLGYPVTGSLSTFEQDLLVNSYNRAQAGGYATQQKIASNVEGTRGLLKIYRAEMAGGATMQPGTMMAVAPTPVMPQVPMQVVPQPQMVVTPQVTQPAHAAPVTMAAATVAVPQVVAPLTAAAQPAKATGPLPSLFGAPAQTEVDLAAKCQAMGLASGSSFQFTKADQVTDEDFAMSQQFCVARAFAVSTGEELGQSLGASSDQIASLCSVYAERLKPFVTALGVADRGQVQTMAEGFVSEAGIPEAQLAGTAQVCLGHGYAEGDLDMAMGAALLLSGLGQGAYGELLAHHLHAGTGIAADADRASDWFDASLAAAAVDPVFAPSQPERLEVMSSILFPTRAATVPVSGAALPTFAIQQ